MRPRRTGLVHVFLSEPHYYEANGIYLVVTDGVRVSASVSFLKCEESTSVASCFMILLELRTTPKGEDLGPELQLRLSLTCYFKSTIFLTFRAVCKALRVLLVERPIWGCLRRTRDLVPLCDGSPCTTGQSGLGVWLQVLVQLPPCFCSCPPSLEISRGLGKAFEDAGRMFHYGAHVFIFPVRHSCGAPDSVVSLQALGCMTLVVMDSGDGLSHTGLHTLTSFTTHPGPIEGGYAEYVRPSSPTANLDHAKNEHLNVLERTAVCWTGRGENRGRRHSIVVPTSWAKPPRCGRTHLHLASLGTGLLRKTLHENLSAESWYRSAQDLVPGKCRGRQKYPSGASF